ncbi:hypothetical protein ACSFBM_15550 [Variovorax sp. GB1R11]|uniref:hypothetical protein n=1 Tax=Variovorax sp. GB1R11 TaxID=3443741 RepID=UPI003F490195
MSNEALDLSRVVASVKEVCAGTKTAVIHGAFSRGNGASVIELGHAEMLEAIRAERPAAVFYSLIKFDADGFIHLVLQANGWKEGYDKRPGSRFPSPDKVRAHVQSQIVSLTSRPDPHHELHVCYSHDGCVRHMEFNEEWAEEFYCEIADFVEAYIDDAEIDNDEAEERAKDAMKDFIRKVSQDEGFKSLRGLPKRLLYLQKHYGDKIPPHPRGRLHRAAQHVELVDYHMAIVLTEASNLIWRETNL